MSSKTDFVVVYIDDDDDDDDDDNEGGDDDDYNDNACITENSSDDDDNEGGDDDDYDDNAYITENVMMMMMIIIIIIIFNTGLVSLLALLTPIAQLGNWIYLSHFRHFNKGGNFYDILIGYPLHTKQKGKDLLPMGAFSFFFFFFFF